MNILLLEMSLNFKIISVLGLRIDRPTKVESVQEQKEIISVLCEVELSWICGQKCSLASGMTRDFISAQHSGLKGLQNKTDGGDLPPTRIYPAFLK